MSPSECSAVSAALPYTPLYPLHGHEKQILRVGDKECIAHPHLCSWWRATVLLPSAFVSLVKAEMPRNWCWASLHNDTLPKPLCGGYVSLFIFFSEKQVPISLQREKVRARAGKKSRVHMEPLVSTHCHKGGEEPSSFEQAPEVLLASGGMGTSLDLHVRGSPVIEENPLQQETYLAVTQLCYSPILPFSRFISNFSWKVDSSGSCICNSVPHKNKTGVKNLCQHQRTLKKSECSSWHWWSWRETVQISGELTWAFRHSAKTPGPSGPQIISGNCFQYCLYCSLHFLITPPDWSGLRSTPDIKESLKTYLWFKTKLSALTG